MTIFERNNLMNARSVQIFIVYSLEKNQLNVT